MPEAWSVWPFWEYSDGLAELTPSELGLSEEVTRAAREWYDFWFEHAEKMMRWDSDENRSRFLQSGAELVARIQADVGNGWEVEGVPGISIPGTPASEPPSPSSPAPPAHKPTGWWGLPPRA